MKKAVLLPLCLAAAPVFANEDTGPYIGVKYGKFVIDVEEVNEPTDGGFLFGYRFGGGGAIEVEHTEADADVVSGGIQYGTVSIETTAIYLAYRTPGDAYLKVRAGLLKEEVSGQAEWSYCYYDGYYDYTFCESDSVDVEEKDDTGLSVGIGAGFNLGSVAQLEFEYTIIEQDVSFLSAGLNLRF
ncbi:MAG: outer membrane beta-barrel protein [Gammaproteobacteria bacterium]